MCVPESENVVPSALHSTVQAATETGLYSYLPVLTARESCDPSSNYFADFISWTFNKIKLRLNLKRDYITTPVYRIWIREFYFKLFPGVLYILFRLYEGPFISWNLCNANTKLTARYTHSLYSRCQKTSSFNQTRLFYWPEVCTSWVRCVVVHHKMAYSYADGGEQATTYEELWPNSRLESTSGGPPVSGIRLPVNISTSRNVTQGPELFQWPSLVRDLPVSYKAENYLTSRITAGVSELDSEVVPGFLKHLQSIVGKYCARSC